MSFSLSDSADLLIKITNSETQQSAISKTEYSRRIYTFFYKADSNTAGYSKKITAQKIKNKKLNWINLRSLKLQVASKYSKTSRNCSHSYSSQQYNQLPNISSFTCSISQINLRSNQNITSQCPSNSQLSFQ